MSAEDRVSVKTSVPEYQKHEWAEHADGLDMTQSEFVRTMVQAGRRGFELDPPDTDSSAANPRGNVLRKPILEALSAEEHRSFDKIVDEVETQLDQHVNETLKSLAADGLVELSPRGGGRLMEGVNGDD